MHRSHHSLAFCLIASGLLAGVASAQNPAPRIRILEAPRAMTLAAASSNRAVIGVALSTGNVADTLGLEIIDVTADGPAALAGLQAGSRIQSINGVSLRISEADARDPLTADAGYKRLQRELGKLEAGDTVTLSVLESGKVRTVSLATTSAMAMATGRVGSALVRSRESMENRAGLGMRVSSADNARDTLGVFITSVTTDGPVEKAGIIEGERVAAINGVDVRVPREDAGIASAAEARVARFSRELAKVKPGEQVALRVFSNGRYRDVTVTAGKASDFGGTMFRFETVPGLETFWRAPVAPSTPRPPRTLSVPRVPAAPAAPGALGRTRSAGVAM